MRMRMHVRMHGAKGGNSSEDGKSQGFWRHGFLFGILKIFYRNRNIGVFLKIIFYERSEYLPPSCLQPISEWWVRCGQVAGLVGLVTFPLLDHHDESKPRLETVLSRWAHLTRGALDRSLSGDLPLDVSLEHLEGPEEQVERERDREARGELEVEAKGGAGPPQVLVQL